jgi:amidase
MKTVPHFLFCVLVIAWAQSVYAQAFEVSESAITDEGKAMTEGCITSRALVQAYLDRIDAFDRRGPRLNALIANVPRKGPVERCMEFR